jgi:hypothetical protein
MFWIDDQYRISENARWWGGLDTVAMDFQTRWIEKDLFQRGMNKGVTAAELFRYVCGTTLLYRGLKP